MPSWADTDVGDGCACEFGEAVEVGACVLGELVPGIAFGGVALPAGESFVDGDDAVPGVAVGGWVFVFLTIDFVVGADVDHFPFVESIETSDGQSGDSIDHAGVAHEDDVEPAAGASAAGGRSEFATESMEVFPKFLIVGRERAGSDAGGVGFADSYDRLDGEGRKAGSGGATSRSGVRGSDEGVGAKVDVEEGALGAFEENHFFRFPCLVNDGDDVGDVRTEPVERGRDGVDDAVYGEGRETEGLENGVGFRDTDFEEFTELLGANGVSETDSFAVGLVRVGGADATLGGADFFIAELGLTGGIEFAVKRKNEVGAIRDEELLGVDGDALAFEGGDFLAKADGVEDDAVADDVLLTRPENAGGDEMEDVFFAFDDDSVSCVGAALAANDKIGIFGEQVDDFSFSFIAPLEAYDYGIHGPHAARIRPRGEEVQ